MMLVRSVEKTICDHKKTHILSQIVNVKVTRHLTLFYYSNFACLSFSVLFACCYLTLQSYSV